ncbi:MAG TPA: SPFH domain-containing protein [Caldilineaceae bacterium]|nr:SPFH domain-containing protein [Caldilineaceae bacterium]
MQNSRSLKIPGRAIVIGILAFVVILVLFSFTSQFFYFFERVDEDEVGVQFVSGRIKNVVGPGVYSDAGLFVELQRVSSQAVPFSVADEELITRDKQRIGLLVTGDIFRPRLEQRDILQSLWGEYSTLYLDDEAVRVRIEDRARQAMKVCVGNRNFDDAVIGTGRDELRECIDDELNKLADNYGLTVDNVAVPEVILSPEVQARLDEIVQSRLQTEKAAQDKLKAEAEAAAEQARQEGEIRVQQSRIQEESRQQAILAELERQKIEAQRAVIEAERANELARVEAERAIIEAEKANELLAAQMDLDIQAAQALAAAERAKAEVAVQRALAEVYASSPGYLQLQIVEANASALQSTDKIIFTPEGMVPTLVMPGPGIVPTVDASQQTADAASPVP